MAFNDITVVYPAGQNQVPSHTFRTEAAATAILLGEPVKIGGTGNNYVVPLGNGEPIIATDIVAGVAATDGTHTATADGVVDVMMPLPGVVFRCKATTPANIDTDAKLLALLNDRVTFDLGAGVYTVDENEGDGATHGIRMIGGNIVTGDIDFVFLTTGIAYAI